MHQASGVARIEEGGVANLAILNPLVEEITSALFELGGAAHRDMVVAQIAKKRGIFRLPPTMGLELDAAFSAYCCGTGDTRPPGLLHLPYGPCSHRWALTDQAYGLLRSRTVSGAV